MSLSVFFINPVVLGTLTQDCIDQVPILFRIIWLSVAVHLTWVQGSGRRWKRVTGPCGGNDWAARDRKTARAQPQVRTKEVPSGVHSAILLLKNAAGDWSGRPPRGPSPHVGSLRDAIYVVKMRLFMELLDFRAS